MYKNGKRLFSSNDIDRAFSKKRKIFTFSNGTIRGFSNKSGKQYGTVNDFKKFSIQRKTKNGTVRYGTVRYGTIRYVTIRYGTVRYGTVRYDTVRYEKGTVTNSDALL